jgi:predicted transposase YdaD
MAEEPSEAQKQEAIALNPLRQGLTIDAIAQVTGLTIAQLQQLQAENQ